ncbi:hypothetical protein KSD_85570 [Ktedonobacter sp. SOSP1-85]|uniref:nucleotidyltransferase domain-containing protein n=1 Tax=Ktedonobacter sp. SOSP1-85 TaxID=2778367 RepID=UPI0019162731|nr:nucleotidyltransferase domain-containing protein [Ktedonobacter sp. SOSP1-85]GHO80786.1 hypothetical protein KSD_85570 [Ktedonobacter sp. SOSP1-85]
MEQASQVEQLLSQAIQAFASDPYVYEIYLFGSYAKKTHDRYSDVDLHIVSQNFDATMSQLWHYLEEIGPVLMAFPLVARVGYTAFMILFENFPLYTKLDINIADRTENTSFAEQACVYRREALPPHVAPTFLPTMLEEPLNTLYGYHLGAIRYMKYRKRGKHFSAYKFYKAQLDRTLLNKYQEICHDFSVERLGLLEYQLLDTYEESIQLKRYLYPENERAMDTFYIELLQTMTHELQYALNTKHEKALTTIIDFLKQEAL